MSAAADERIKQPFMIKCAGLRQADGENLRGFSDVILQQRT